MRPLRLAALLILVTGCSKFRQAKECSSLVETVSAWMAEDTVSAAKVDPLTVAQDARKTAERYRKLDQDLGRLGIKSPDLAPRVKRYRAMATEAARVLDDVARALDQKDAERARRRRVEFDATARGEAPLVAEINRVCGR